MQSNFKLLENHFLKNYHPILSHHMNCILESRMMLDEDLHLLITFWCPNSSAIKAKSVQATAACAVSAVAGGILSLKLNAVYPLIASLTPTLVHLTFKSTILYYKRKYRKNCETLLSYLAELHEVNRDVLEYNHRVMLNTPQMSESGIVLLTNTRCSFLKLVITTLLEVLQNLIRNMRKINDLVPITEGEYMYAAEWNLEHFMPGDASDFNEILHKFESLSDLSVLIVSNFLGCVGLTFCTQLWKGNAVHFKRIFDDVIPGLCVFLRRSLHSIRENFNRVRFTLVDCNGEYKRELRQKRNLQLQQPLDDFLLNMQAVFEMASGLQVLLVENKSYDNPENLMRFIDDIDRHFVICGDSFKSVVKLARSTSKVVLEKREVTNRVNENTFLTPIEIHHDDPLPFIEDEEYSLSIHGSDDDDIIAPIIDYADQFSSENLELMLVELKRKLDERKLRKSNVVNVDDIEQEPVDDTIPPPSVIPCLPAIENVHSDFLAAVRTIAQNLNRREEFQFGFNMFPEIPRPFNTTYRCYSVAMLPGNERQDVERGGKIIMPPSALEQLTRLNINYPMLFKIINKKANRTTHCGVLEFVADEGKVYFPLWMMHNLVLDEGDLIQIESVSLAVGTFAKFQPLSPEFLDITNPKAVLENCLRTFACLTTGDVIAVKYNQKAYELCVLETQPGNAISIIECDMNVEFAAPIGYKEAEISRPNEDEMVVDPADLMPEPTGFVAFKGAGNRLDGKRRKDSSSSDMPVQKPVYVRGIPDYDYEIGTLRFLRNIKTQTVDKDENPEFKVFGGQGFSMKRGI